MCSFLVQIVYGFVCFVATAMTLSSMFTPEWATYVFPASTLDDLNQGILPYTCGLEDNDAKAGMFTTWKTCDEWFDGLPWTNSLVIAAMSLGLLFQVLAFIWNIFTVFACCCKKYVIHALPVFSLLSTIFLCVAIAFYALNDQWYLQPNALLPTNSVDMWLGYSFWMACGAAGVNIICMIVASVAIGCTRGA